MARSTPAQRAELVAAYRRSRSSMTQHQFAVSRGVPVSRLQSWLYKRAPTPTPFVEITAPEPAAREGVVVVELGEHVTCRFFTLPPADYVAKFVAALRAC